MKKLTFLLITKRVESLLQAIQYGQKKYRAFITLAMNTRYGRNKSTLVERLRSTSKQSQN